MNDDTVYMYAAIGGLVILNGFLCMLLEKPIGGRRLTTGICSWSSLGMSMMAMQVHVPLSAVRVITLALRLTLTDDGYASPRSLFCC